MVAVDPLFVTVVLLVAGVLASLVPLVPGGFVSIVGVVYYWYVTGEPGTIAFVTLLVLGGVTVLLDWLGSALAAHVGGASLRTTAIAAVVAIALLFVLGPLGALFGIAATVFTLEYWRHGDVRRGLETASYATLGVLASTAMQILLTATILIAFLVAVLL